MGKLVVGCLRRDTRTYSRKGPSHQTEPRSLMRNLVLWKRKAGSHFVSAAGLNQEETEADIRKRSAK